MADIDKDKEPIEVTSAQGVTDMLQSIIANVVIVLGFFGGAVAVTGKQGAEAGVVYVQQNLGPAVAAIFLLVSIGTALYRIYFTYKRGAQLATAAAEPDHIVSNDVLRLKGDPPSAKRR